MSSTTTRINETSLPFLVYQDSPKTQLTLPLRQQTNKLCAICRSIDFRGYKHRKLEERILLAPWSTTTNSCPFCRLVRHCILNQANEQQREIDMSCRVWLKNVQSWRLGVELSPYDPTKSEKNSNEAELRARAKQLQNVAYRFVIHVEDEKGRRREAGQIQYLARQDESAEDRQFFGRQLDRNAANMGLIKSWLRRCESTHGPTCEMSDLKTDQLPPGFRVIDVHRRVVIRAPRDCRYFALSYVWGVQEMLEATGLKPVTLQSADLALDANGVQLPAALPRTIADALDLTSELGYNYLWVDALCIIQDQDQKAKHLHLSRMDAVYSAATLTIVAGSGRHADVGLPGVYGNVRISGQYVETVKGRKLAAMLPSYSDVENSRSLVWNSRGWTLQEKLLSKRVLLFTDSQVYYKCSQSIWTEQIWMESRRLRDSKKSEMAGCYRWSHLHRDLESRQGMQGDMVEWMEKTDGNPLGSLRWSLAMNDRFTFLMDHRPKREHGELTTFAAALRESTEKPWFQAYLSAVEECTQRSLTDPNDLFFSMNGIFRLLGDGPKNFHFGLPRSEFRKSLLWRPVAGASMTPNRTPWPSWSWASWNFGQQGISFYHPGNEALLTILAFRALLSKLRRQAENSLQRSKVRSRGANSDIEESADEDADRGGGRGPARRPSAQITSQTAHLSDRVDWNLKACLDQSHSWTPRPKFMFYCNDGKVQPISDILMHSAQYEEELNDSFPIALALSKNVPLLLLETWAVQFRIGQTLIEVSDPEGSENALFELVDDYGACVGETWTSHKVAGACSTQKVDCITISETWTFEKADIDEQYRPRWEWSALADDEEGARQRPENTSLLESIAKLALRLFNAFEQLRHEEVFSSRMKFAQACLNRLNKIIREKEGGPSDTETDAAAYTLQLQDSKQEVAETKPQERPSIRERRRSRLENQPKGAFLSLLSAKKGKPVPRFLWKVVEVMLVRWEGDVAWRIGTGKIAYDAWKAAFPIPRRVMLA